MPVNSTHPQYQKFLPMWTTCRDVVEGEVAIKEAGVKYLPMLTGHIKKGLDGLAAYGSYKQRANWFGATDRTLSGYVGAIMRRDPAIKVPGQIHDRLEDITNDGQTAEQFVNTLCRELLTTGRLGLLVDKSSPTEIACIKLYYPENILNWQFTGDKLTRVVLQECVYEPDAGDPYTTVEVTKIRELRLENGQYQSIEWSGDGKNGWVSGPVTTPTFRDTPLDEIPFIFVSASEDAQSCSKPPIFDLASCNLKHYQLDADYRHGLHFTALPTAVFTGVEEDREYYLGSEGAVNLRDPNARAFYLEFQGLGLTAIKDALAELKDQMASLGAQLLSRKTGGRTVETAEAARIQHAGETSLLSTVVGRVEEGLELALMKVATWEGMTVDEESDEIEVQINRDFIDATLTAPEIQALVASWQNGGISPEVLFWNLQKGGVIEPKKTFEEYMKELDAENARRKANQPPAGGLPAAQDGSPDGTGGPGTGGAGNGQAPGAPKGAEGVESGTHMEE